MSDVYESIVAGLQEAIEDAKSKEKKKPSAPCRDSCSC